MQKINILTFLTILGLSGSLSAQQLPMFTKYMFNPLSYNPGYAGSADALDVVLLHRHQWVGFGQDAPMTQNLTMHAPIKTKNIGIGLNMSYDRMPRQQSFSFFPTVAYRIKFGDHSDKGKGGYVSMGLQGGVSNWRADWAGLNVDDPNDPAFQNQQPNVWLPNFGAGIYVHTKTWFAGFSSPLLITNALRKRTINEPQNMPIAQQFRHYYLTGGAAFKISSDVIFRPTLLIKNIGLFVEKNQLGRIGAPNEFDIDLAFLFKKQLWVGVAFRSAFELGSSSYDSADFWASLRLKNGLRVGFAFDYTLTRIARVAQGTYEVMLGYDLLRLNIEKIDHVRYF
jgi:type IX secretion system PorP/SprF family membrane protein